MNFVFSFGLHIENKLGGPRKSDGEVPSTENLWPQAEAEARESLAPGQGPSIGGPHPYFGYNPHSENTDVRIYINNSKIGSRRYTKTRVTYKPEIIFFRFHFNPFALISQIKKINKNTPKIRRKKQKKEKRKKKEDKKKEKKKGYVST